MGVVRFMVRAFIGLLFGAITAMLLVPALAAFGGAPGEDAVWSLAVVAACMLLTAFAPTIRRAFGRGFLLAGAAAIALPLSTLLLSGRTASDMVTASGGDAATAVGAGIGGALLTGAAGFVGFFLGAIFLIAGLVLSLGGRREVIVVGPDGRRPAA